MNDNQSAGTAATIREARLAMDRALGQGHLVQLTGAQLDDAAAAVVNRLDLNAVSVLTEVRAHAAREASIYAVSADQYAQQNNEARMDDESATARAFRDIVDLIDRLAPGLPIPEQSVPVSGGNDPWAGR